MTLPEIYLYLFFDSILASLILVPNVEMAYIVMKVSGYYNLTIMIAIAILGNIIGSALNYSLGYIVREAKRLNINWQDTEKLENLSRVVDKYLIYLNLFSYLPIIGVIFTGCSGFFRVSFRKYLLINLASRIGYYCLPLIFS